MGMSTFALGAADGFFLPTTGVDMWD